MIPRGRTLLVVIVLAVIAAIVIVSVTRKAGDEKKCVAVTEANAVDIDRSDDEARILYLAEHEDSPLPLVGWSQTSQSADGTVFTSNEHGHWEMVVRHGTVRSYTGCPA